MYCLVIYKFVGIDEFFQTHTKFCDLDLHFALQWTLILTLAWFFSFATSISYTTCNSEHFQLQGHIQIFSFSLLSICCNPVFSPYIYYTIFNHFQGFFKVFWGRISAPLPMEKGPVFSQKVDDISESEVHQTFSNFSSLIDEYLGIQSWLFLDYSNANKDTM